MNALNLTALTASDAEMPATKRGRTAEPIPDNILSAVKDTFNGSAKAFTIPLADKDGEDVGKDDSVRSLVAVLRRAAASLDLGLSVAYDRPTKTQGQVIFKAKTKTERVRRTRDQIEQDTLIAYWTENEATEYDGDDNDENALAAWERYVTNEDSAE